MKGFTFSQEYYDTIKKIKRKQDREMFVNAILEFIFEDKEPEELSDIAMLAFEIHRNSLQTSKKRSKSGETKQNQKKNKRETKQNQNAKNDEFENDLISGCSRFDFAKEKNTPIKERSKENYNPQEKENIPPIIPPQGDGERDFKAKFFSVYCQFKKFAGNDYPEIDFEKLLDEFNKSSQLRKIFSWQVVLDSYPAIIRGDFRDKDKPNPFADVDVKAARERWYAERRAKAENQANGVLERFLQNEEFKRIHKRLRTIELDLAKAECDPKGQKQLVKLTQDKAQLTLQYRGIIELNGMTEEDLLPKWHCRKCSDTGYLTDGRMCDCYEVAL